MNKSESITKLASALSMAQPEFECVRHDSDNPFFKSKYASLGAMIASTSPIMEKFGLSISQLPIGDGGEFGVETVLMHESGEWISNTATIKMPESKNPAQEAGKAITYLRRYGWQSILGVYSGDDDDAQSLTKTAKKMGGVEEWTTEQLQAVVDSGAAKALPHAKNILNNSNLKTPNDNAGWCEWYGKAYLKAKEEGLETKDAAKRANSSYTKATEKK